ncbi:ABC transporter substrate-binding protein [Cutibacterium equinum]|uniref:ABC transporter substrate-binding protein n=1 Tax=Cutibacterium equinum TaxID=3016342 RepID=A0ABY7QYJ8_9ACTN|nr:ABC transporter substrate-binding protein [Cutibacterium equinum]WCC80056.1 ABC transporter substrate-binding protein [Cutibacterium equinum]
MTINRRIAGLAAIALTLATLTGCSQSSPTGKDSDSASKASSSSQAQQGCIKDFDSSKDYFPDKATFSDARGLTVSYHKSYKVVTVKTPSNTSKKETTYVLVQCGAPQPKLDGDLAQAQKITIPTTRVALGSTTGPMKFQMMNKLDSVVGMTSVDKVGDPKTRQALKDHKVADFGVGDETTEVNTEKLAALRPDLFIISGHDDPSKFAKVKEMGTPVVAEPDFLENTPLGRAEWIKYDALFVNAEKAANAKYDDIAKRYHETTKLTANVTTRPSVLYGYQFKGVWYIKSNENYSIQFLRDAGGEYVFKDVHGVTSSKLDTETILKKAHDADFWIDGQINESQKASIPTIVKDDPRMKTLKPVRNGNVWNGVLRDDPKHGNDYWQTGVVRPDLVLADLSAILHPELSKNHTFTFYKKAPAK